MFRNSRRSPRSLLCAAAACVASQLAMAAPDQAVVTLSVSPEAVVKPKSGANPTVAVDRRSGTVYLSWAEEAPSPTGGETRHIAVLARSNDGGHHFGAPVVVSAPQDDVGAYPVSPTRVAVGPKNDVYVLYGRKDPDYKAGHWPHGRTVLRLAASHDGGKTFAAPVDLGSEAQEGVPTSTDMLNLFVSPQGGLYASYLDFRQRLGYSMQHEGEPPRDVLLNTQLRIARSTDGGRTFGRSVLVSEPTCGCCGTQVAQGTSGPLYATTRSAWRELKGSMDEVRDLFISASSDQGQSWSKATKIHNDGFKVSGCPDVTSGLVVDSRGRLHAAWYTGTDRHPGVFYARSDDQGKTFSKPLQLLSGDWIPYSHVKLAVDGEDTAWVAFADRRGDEDMIQVARVSEDGPAVLSKPWVGIAPDVAALERGAIVTWSTKAAEGEDDSRGGGIKTSIVQIARGS